MKFVHVTIIGVTPLLQSRMTEEAQSNLPGSSTRGQKVRKAEHAGDTDPRSVAESATYKNGTTYGHPMAGIVGAMSVAGKNYKLTGTRRSLGYLVHAAVCQSKELIGLTAILDPDTMAPATAFEVDSRTAVNQKTKGRVLTHRPVWHRWAMRFELAIDDDLLSPVQLHRCLEDAGRMVGIGAYRVEKGGPFGRFRVTEWQEQEQQVKDAAE